VSVWSVWSYDGGDDGRLYEKRQIGVRTGMLNWRSMIGLVCGWIGRVGTKFSIRFNADHENRKRFSFDRAILIGWVFKKRRRGRQLAIKRSPRRGKKAK
jgi:hypothetical protein